MQRSGECRDRFSHYLTPDQNKLNEEDSINGEFGGIGATLELRDGSITIVAPMPNTPAERARLKPGDIILKIDDKEPNTLIEAVKLIRGKEGTRVKLTVLRKDRTKPLELVLVREVIIAHPTTSTRDPKHPTIGIVKVAHFDGNTFQSFKDAINSIKARGVNRIVIDLRNNPGGLVNVVLDMLGLFAKEHALALTIRTKYESESVGYPELFMSLQREIGLFKDMKVAVLINGGSASASEIFAGTMKDWGYPIVGEKSFGKGVGQNRFNLTDGSVLWLTTFEFLVGNNRVPIRDEGVTPTIEVKQPEESKRDLQLNKVVKILEKMH